MPDEVLRSKLASHMQSFSSIVLETLVDGRLSGNQTQAQIGIKCREDLIKLSSSALKNAGWALKVTDSNGQLSSGVASGALFNAIGNYEQCIESSPASPIGGTKFCIAAMSLSERAPQLAPLIGQPESWFSPQFGGKPVQLGLCVPISCVSAEIISLASSISNQTIPSTRFDSISCSSGSGPASHLGFFCFLIIIAALISLSVAATVLDSAPVRLKSAGIYSRVTKLTEIFSLRKSLVTFRAKRPILIDRRVKLVPLDALRTLSMFWIMIMHSYTFSFQWLPYDNLNKVGAVYKSPMAQWLSNGTFAVDNFFLVSGFLSWSKHLRLHQIESESEGVETFNSSRKFTRLFDEFILGSIQRYLSLMPNLMFMIAFSINALPFLSYGPNWSQSTMMFDLWCRDKWALNLLMVHNLFASQTMCFSHSWYVAVSMQLFIVLQIIIVIIKTMRPWKISMSWVILASVLVCQLVASALTYTKGLPAMPLLPGVTVATMTEYYGKVYILPYHWFASYFIGVWAADKLHARWRQDGDEKREPSKRESSPIRVLIIILLLVTLIMWTWPSQASSVPMSDLHSSLYALIARPLWSLGVASLLLHTISLTRKCSPPARLFVQVVSWPAWTSLSRLSYSVYLIHPVIMATFYGSRWETFQFSHLLLVYFTIGHMVLSYLFAFALHLFFEQPVRAAIGELDCLRLRYPRKLPAPISSNAAASIRLRPRCSAVSGRRGQ